MYFVVFWDKTSGIVPASWVDSESRTFKWPKTKNPTLQIIRAENAKDNWITYNYIRLSGPFETYDEARDFELDALNLSTNDDEGFAAIKTKQKLEIVEKGKRICNKPLPYCDTEDKSTPVQKKTKSKKKLISSSSSSECEESEINNIPMPPTTYVSQKDQESPTTFTSPTPIHHSRIKNQVKSSHFTYKSINSFNNIDENNTDNDLVEISPASSLFSIPISISIPIRIQMDHSRQSNIEQPPPTSIRPLTKLQDDNHMSLPGSDTHGHGCCRKVLSELKSFKTLVSSIFLTLSDKNDIASNNTVNETIDFRLPIQTRSQLAVFESKIQNVIAATQYRENIKQLGGASFEKHVRKTLVFTVSDTMAYKMSWTGAKNTIKIDGLAFIKLITDTILQKWSASDKEKIEKVIKSWFQHAGDRLK